MIVHIISVPRNLERAGAPKGMDLEKIVIAIKLQLKKEIFIIDGEKFMLFVLDGKEEDIQKLSFAGIKVERNPRQ